MDSIATERKILDFLVRVALIGTLAVACVRIALPFLEIVLWGGVMAVALRPLHARLASWMRGRDTFAAVLIALVLLLAVLAPTLLLAESLVSAVKHVAADVRSGGNVVPTPPASVESWPLVGKKLHALWSLASENFAAFAEAEAGPLRELASKALRLATGLAQVAGQFVLAAVAAGVMLAMHERSARGLSLLAERLAPSDGARLLGLAAVTVRNVALGVLGVAMLQSVLTGVGLLLAGVPGAGLLALVALVLCVAQVGPGLILLGAAIWLFSEGDMLKAGAFVVFSLFVMVIDNVLKPLVFGRKGGAPLLVVFIGALGGFMANGVIGLFTGAVVLAVGWELLRAWVMKGGGDREGTGSTASSDGASSDGALPDGALSDGTVAASSGAESGA